MNAFDDIGRVRADVEKEVRSELSSLRKQVAKLSESLNDLGHEVVDDWKDDAADTWRHMQRRGKKTVRKVRRQAYEVADTAQDYPLTTLAVVAGIGFLALAFSAWEREHR